jgi:hypothetical protein
MLRVQQPMLRVVHERQSIGTQPMLRHLTANAVDTHTDNNDLLHQAANAAQQQPMLYRKDK